MFGRKGLTPPPAAPQPPQQWWPVAQLGPALDATLALFTSALHPIGRDLGPFSRTTAVSGVANQLTGAIVNDDARGREFVNLGITTDFKGFTYQPHCHLFLILNAVNLLEDPLSADLRNQIAASQLARPCADAVIMRAWLDFVEPVGKAVASKSEAALDAVAGELVHTVVQRAGQLPEWIAHAIDLRQVAHEWGSGFPGLYTQPIEEAEMLNGLAMRPFVVQLITEFLANLQSGGLSQGRT
jgi:hypothetical protein